MQYETVLLRYNLFIKSMLVYWHFNINIYYINFLYFGVKSASIA